MSRQGEGIMRQLWLLGLVIAVGAAPAGCGKSEQERKVEEAQQAAEKAAEDMARGFEGLARAMEGVAKSGAEGAAAEPVSFRDLETALPDVPGWTRDAPRGERMTSPIPFSQAEADYASGGARVEARIVDSAFNQLLMAPWAMFLTAGYERETSDGYERSVQIDGHPGFERWESANRSGELNLVIARRFLVTIEGHDIDDPKVLRDFADRIDKGRLAALK
jgi:hypothetical protein